MEKPRLSFWQIWNMSFGFLGIQFGWTLQMNNMSAIYEYLGAEPGQLPLLWLAAPLTGLLVQPIIGHWSDNTWGPLGRRRPFFLVGALLSSCALILMPLSSALWMAAGLLWILDASINISMEPFRAFVADMLPDEQRARGFTMQGFFIGVGSVGASYLPLLLQKMLPAGSTGSGRAIPEVVRVAFIIGAAAFISAVLFTVFTTKEYPPSTQERERLKTAKRFDLQEIIRALRDMPVTMRQLALVQFLTRSSALPKS
jgi:maltose/moltooligosaccharide transporter